MRCAEYFIARRDLHYSIPQWDALHFDHRVTYLRGASAVAAGVDPTLRGAARLIATVDDADTAAAPRAADDGVEWLDVEPEVA